MRRATAASFGKIPMTSLRRLISPLRRSSRFVLCKFGPPLGWEVHVGENICLGIIHQGGEFRTPWPGLIGGDLAPLLAGGVDIILGEGATDPQPDADTPVPLRCLE